MESRRERSAQEVALNNPIILTEILQQYDTPLKSCRLVSHFWNDMVLSLQNTRLELNLDYENKELNNALPFFALCYPSDDRLAKHISATCSTLVGEEDEPPHRVDSFAYRIMHICDKFTDQIQILEISIVFEDCLQAIFQILKNCCPSLKQLQISHDLSEYECDLAGAILPAPLLPKPNLTLFEVYSQKAVTPSLTSLIQLVVTASPNLRKVSIPWGFYPDFANSKCLTSLTTLLDDQRAMDVALAEFSPTQLSRMLTQVGDQLVSLSFVHYDNFGRQARFDFKEGTTRFRLPRNMSKLQNFRNEMIDIFQADVFLQNVEALPALKSLGIGTIFMKSVCVEEILKIMYEKNTIFGNITHLSIFEMHDPKLLEGLKTAFPNLEVLEVDTSQKQDSHGEVSRMELGVVLKSCRGWEGTLKHLHIGVPSYPQQVTGTMQALLDAREVFKGLRTLETSTHHGNYWKNDFTENELGLFKQLLIALDGMESVRIQDILVGEESLRKILYFLVSKKMQVSKFKMLQEGWMDSFWDSIVQEYTTQG